MLVVLVVDEHRNELVDRAPPLRKSRALIFRRVKVSTVDAVIVVLQIVDRRWLVDQTADRKGLNDDEPPLRPTKGLTVRWNNKSDRRLIEDEAAKD